MPREKHRVWSLGSTTRSMAQLGIDRLGHHPAEEDPGTCRSCRLRQPGTLTVNKVRCPLSCIRRSKAFDQGTLLFPSLSAGEVSPRTELGYGGIWK